MVIRMTFNHYYIGSNPINSICIYVCMYVVNTILYMDMLEWQTNSI